ncbi:hypothetical protein ACFC06_00915 [Nocardia sp. NPDC056064]|uniref:hypothetical protein n=1 Tax=Nocardia sp. NPDC056064 TaxID=3345701 RepID=UPI0035DC0B46
MRAEEVRRTGHRAGVLAVGSLLLTAASLLAWLICTIAAWLSSGSDLYRPSKNHSRFTGWADAASNWATVLFVAGITLYIVRIVARHVGSHLAETEAAHAEELRDRDRRIQRRQELDRRLDDRVSSALTAFERLPTHLRDAEAALDRAGIDYDENAYAPTVSAHSRSTPTSPSA